MSWCVSVVVSEIGDGGRVVPVVSEVGVMVSVAYKEIGAGACGESFPPVLLSLLPMVAPRLTEGDKDDDDEQKGRRRNHS